MSFELVRPIRYGNKQGTRFKLPRGTIVDKKFFDKATRTALWNESSIIKSDKAPTIGIDGIKVPEIVDITTMTVVQAKEFLDNEPHVAMLEKYLDQANKEEFPRKTIVEFIERRIKGLTDTDF